MPAPTLLFDRRPAMDTVAQIPILLKNARLVPRDDVLKMMGRPAKHEKILMKLQNLKRNLLCGSIKNVHTEMMVCTSVYIVEGEKGGFDVILEVAIERLRDRLRIIQIKDSAIKGPVHRWPLFFFEHLRALVYALVQNPSDWRSSRGIAATSTAGYISGWTPEPHWDEAPIVIDRAEVFMHIKDDAMRALCTTANPQVTPIHLEEGRMK